MSTSPKLTIVILSYNTKDLLKACLYSIESIKDKISKEIVVCDNGSSDGSIEMVEKLFPKVVVVKNGSNLGFAKGNNAARKVARGKYVLFLNSDTEVKDGSFDKTAEYLDKNLGVAAITCKILLPDGSLDKDARRSFPTPWVALTHFSYLDRLFPKSKLFSKYWYGYRSSNVAQEVDVLEGAFMLVRKDVLDLVDWYDEDYFLDAEDIDLCWKIKEKGYKIIYYPFASIIHVKKASKRSNRKVAVISGMKSMELFYRKRLWKRYPILINWMVIFGIKMLSLVRTGKKMILG